PALSTLESGQSEGEAAALAAGGALVEGFEGGAVVGVDEGDDGAAEHAAQVVGLDHAQAGGVHVEQVSVERDDFHAFGFAFEDGAQAGFAVGPGLLGEGEGEEVGDGDGEGALGRGPAPGRPDVFDAEHAGALAGDEDGRVAPGGEAGRVDVGAGDLAGAGGGAGAGLPGEGGGEEVGDGEGEGALGRGPAPGRPDVFDAEHAGEFAGDEDGRVEHGGDAERIEVGVGELAGAGVGAGVVGVDHIAGGEGAEVAGEVGLAELDPVGVDGVGADKEVGADDGGAIEVEAPDADAPGAQDGGDLFGDGTEAGTFVVVGIGGVAGELEQGVVLCLVVLVAAEELLLGLLAAGDVAGEHEVGPAFVEGDGVENDLDDADVAVFEAVPCDGLVGV